MAETDDIDSEDAVEVPEPPKRSRAPLLIGLVLFLLLGGGSFFAVYSGMAAIPGLGGGGESKSAHGGGHGGGHGDDHGSGHAAASGGASAFVPMGEMVIPLGPNAKSKFLVLETQIETSPDDAAAIEALRPRVLDVFNTFLRAVEESDIEAPSATIRLRAQLLRRVRAVAAPVEPRDLLITSFVLK